MAPKRKRASPATSYQVFLNFRGPDTRQGLTDVLYHALVDAGIRVFRDNEEIRKGEYIGDEILRAIEDSRIFVPIFSRTYASSKWCLIELAKMVESKEKSSGSKRILPIFYDVSVNDVKLKTELYTEALSIHREKFSPNTVQQWEKALREAGKIKGWELKDKGHAEFAKEFVRKVSVELKVKKKYVTGSLVERIDEQDALISLLDLKSSHDVRLVWIHGMGGIGKTTLAKAVFNRLCDHFDGCCFLLDVRETTKRKGIEHLQRQLLQDLGVKSADITDENDGIWMISKKLQSRKVLVVLDDVYDLEQIGKLAGEVGWFGEGSRIIITSRNKKAPVFEGGRVEILEAEPMKFEESLLLFSRHAFGKENPPEDFCDLSEEVVRITGGLPLALEIVGSQLRTSYEHRDRVHWNHLIGTLQKIPAKKVQDRLKISYDALDWEAKKIFLDIACFFINEEKTKAIYMWQSCGFEPYLAVKELVDASLIKLADEKFSMHDQLRDLGRKIVHDERSKNPGRPCSRIWMQEDALKVLKEEEGKKYVEMLSLPYNEHSEDCALTKQELKSFKNLRFLSLYGSNFSGDLEHVLPKLIWLSWHGFPHIFQGTNLYLKNLVVLELSGSLISETWKGWCQIGMCKELKVLDLRSCHRLTKTPDLSVCTKLERLILRDCMNLVEIDHSVGTLKCLKYLNASGCPYLRDIPEEICSLDGVEEIVMVAKGNFQDILKLPDSIGRLSRLKHLSVSLGRGTPPNSLGYLKSLAKLDLSWSKMAELPKSIGGLVKLEYLSLHFCRGITELPDSIRYLKSLAVLDISMSGITRLPSTVEYLQELKVINMRGSVIQSIPRSIRKLKKLEKLDIQYCYRLRNIPSEIEGLPSLLTVSCSAPEIDSVASLVDKDEGWPTTEDGSDWLIGNEMKWEHMISNRKSARQSRMRKQKYLDDLMAMASELRVENGRLAEFLGVIVHLYDAMEVENMVLRARAAEFSDRLRVLNDDDYIGGLSDVY
ncbi:TMV resistance protein N-like isoform X2 [Punica granatum]|uniref:TMV resistance protein N-like isoform X2 n=1 Tax=Punica granatum TaxID=22663 RepID=A0A6P8BQX1_PUNGR|nr:TMV resistance protein N-like isoform X2 [Punica granatum]